MAANAGWYTDPERPGFERYWDGLQWTQHRRPYGAPTSASPPPPPVMSTQPAAKRRKPRKTGMIAVLVISAVVIIAVVAANSNGSNKPKTGGGTSLTTVGGVQTESGNTLHPPAADVRITGCSVDPTVRFASAELTITNHSSKSSNYMVQVGFFNSANVRLDDGYGIENNVPAGGSVDTTAQGLATIPAGTQITCKLVSVDRYASAG